MNVNTRLIILTMAFVVGISAPANAKNMQSMMMHNQLMIDDLGSLEEAQPTECRPNYPKSKHSSHKRHKSHSHKKQKSNRCSPHLKKSSTEHHTKHIASWYGPGFHGRRTASGERFDMYKFTAAHKTLPIGSVVKVTNLLNQKSVVVKINDRGPYVRGRTIDLSYAAKNELSMVGTAPVSIEIMH